MKSVFSAALKRLSYLISLAWSLAASSAFLFSLHAATYFVSPSGNDGNDATLSSPLATVKAGVAKLEAGDSLLLRAGTYWEAGITISLSGTSSNPITISNYQSEEAVIDGGVPEFREVPNDDWEVHDAGLGIWRSKKTYPDNQGSWGGMICNGIYYQLASYNVYANLSSNNELFPAEYAGPGTFWNDSDKRLYVRLKHPSEKAVGKKFEIPSNTDPRQNTLLLGGHPGGITLSGAKHAVLRGIRVQNFATGIEIKNGCDDITFDGVTVRGFKNGFLVRGGSHLLWDGVQFVGGKPDWISRCEIKCSGILEHTRQGGIVGNDPEISDAEVRNSIFDRTFDGIVGGTWIRFRIHHNDLIQNMDDGMQIRSQSRDVEWDHNYATGVGPSFYGTGQPLAPGTFYVHHNIIDTREKMLMHRPDATGSTGRTGGWDSPPAFSSHSDNYGTTGGPWQIFNNTILCSQNEKGDTGPHMTCTRACGPGAVHHGMNNILLQIEDDEVIGQAKTSTEQEVYDGNAYWQSASGATTPLMNRYITRDGDKDFSTLADFLASKYCQETKSYYGPGWDSKSVQMDPKLDGDYFPLNATVLNGGVDLSGFDWPGLDGQIYRGAIPPGGSRSSIGVPDSDDPGDATYAPHGRRREMPRVGIATTGRRIFVSVDCPALGPLHVSLYGADGREIARRTQTVHTASVRTEVRFTPRETESIPSGTYVLSVKTAGSRIQKRFMFVR